ncbi:MAG: HEAT repeat domain-containing protein, partial [Planctomycetota bacterium]
QLERFKNQGISERDRRAALRALLAFWLHEPFAMDPKLKGMRRQIITTVFKVLTASPPKVTIEILGFLRTDFPDPHLLRILVHFVYPFDDDMRTPDVRVAGVRTIAKVAGRAALPTLLYCLRDEPGEVVREADRALTRICEVRSPVGEDVEPLDAKQIAHARRSWRAHFHSDDGAERMREAIRLLRGYVDMDAQFNRSQTSKPIADHIAQTVLIDADMPWSVWKPAYEFLVDYLNKEFRPVVRRGTPVTQEERPAIVAEIDKFWRGDRLELPPPMPPAPNGAEKTAEEERGEESG